MKEIDWSHEFEDGDIWRVFPFGDMLVVGIGGVRRDQNALGLGLQGNITVGGSGDSGSTIFLDRSGKIIKRIVGLSPIRCVDQGIICLRGQHELVLCSETGAIESVFQLEDQQLPIALVACVGDHFVIAYSDGVPLEHIESSYPITLEHCDCVVIDAVFNPVHRFQINDLLVLATSDQYMFGCDFRESAVRRVDLKGQDELIANFDQPAIKQTIDQWVEEHKTFAQFSHNWALSYDEIDNRILGSYLFPPHTVACFDIDGQFLWHRLIHQGCCSGPVSRVDDMFVVASGCGGVVTWLTPQGEIIHQSRDKTRTDHFDPIYPTQVTSGLDGSVFAMKLGRLIQFSLNGDEEVVFEVNSNAFQKITWWPEYESVLLLEGRTLIKL